MLSQRHKAKYMFTDKNGAVCLAKKIPAKHYPKSLEATNSLNNLTYFNKLGILIQSFWQKGSMSSSLVKGNTAKDFKLWTSSLDQKQTQNKKTRLKIKKG